MATQWGLLKQSTKTLYADCVHRRALFVRGRNIGREACAVCILCFHMRLGVSVNVLRGERTFYRLLRASLSLSLSLSLSCSLAHSLFLSLVLSIYLSPLSLLSLSRSLSLSRALFLTISLLSPSCYHFTAIT